MSAPGMTAPAELAPALREILGCPACGGVIRAEPEQLACLACARLYPYHHGVPQLLLRPPPPLAPEKSGGAITDPARRFWPVPSPTYENPLLRRCIPRFLDRFGEGQLVANIGSGGVRYRRFVFNIDLCTGAGVDLLGDACRLPLRNNTLDGIISRRVLEHVRGPNQAVAEMLRVLKPGGLVWCEIPFLQGYHPVPTDFQRYTRDGLRDLFSDFETETTAVALGPGSTLSWVLREYLSIVFSFRRPLLHKVAERVFSLLLEPVKYTDLLLASHPLAAQIASSFYIVARKPGGRGPDDVTG